MQNKKLIAIKKQTTIKLTHHMIGIMNTLSYGEGGVSPTMFIRAALISLAAQGYVVIGKSVKLTKAGKEILPQCVAANKEMRLDASLW